MIFSLLLDSQLAKRGKKAKDFLLSISCSQTLGNKGKALGVHRSLMQKAKGFSFGSTTDCATEQITFRD